jgi:hypothetical protein
MACDDGADVVEVETFNRAPIRDALEVIEGAVLDLLKRKALEPAKTQPVMLQDLPQTLRRPRVLGLTCWKV